MFSLRFFLFQTTQIQHWQKNVSWWSKGVPTRGKCRDGGAYFNPSLLFSAWATTRRSKPFVPGFWPSCHCLWSKWIKLNQPHVTAVSCDLSCTPCFKEGRAKPLWVLRCALQIYAPGEGLSSSTPSILNHINGVVLFHWQTTLQTPFLLLLDTTIKFEFDWPGCFAGNLHGGPNRR